MPRVKKQRQIPDGPPAHAIRAAYNIADTKRRDRLSIISTLYLTGQYTQDDLSVKLREYGYHIGPAAVGDDLKVLRLQWQRQAARNTEQWMAKEIARLDDLEWEAVTKLREFKTVLHIHISDDWRQERKEEVERQAVQKWINATAKYIEVVLAIQNRRARLLGLDKQPAPAPPGPTFNVNVVTVEGVKRLTDAQLEEVIRKRGILPESVASGQVEAAQAQQKQQQEGLDI